MLMRPSARILHFLAVDRDSAIALAKEQVSEAEAVLNKARTTPRDADVQRTLIEAATATVADAKHHLDEVVAKQQSEPEQFWVSVGDFDPEAEPALKAAGYTYKAERFYWLKVLRTKAEVEAELPALRSIRAKIFPCASLANLPLGTNDR